MRVLMQNRFDAFKVYGGDTVQMERTLEHLQRMGVDVSVSLEPEPDLSNYDIVHLFNITRIHETYAQFRNAKQQGKKIALSTIYLDFSEYDRKGRRGLGRIFVNALNKDYFEAVKYLAGAPGDMNTYSALYTMVKTGYANQQKEVLTGVDILLPNSEMEYKKVAEDFNINKRHAAVPNGVEYDAFDGVCSRERAVLCVGRVEPRKNQLNLVRALKGAGVKLILAGAAHKKQKAYCDDVMRELAEIDGIYLGYLQNGSKELKAAYAGAKVHCLPSWFETTGLVSLEAALYGCNIVSTDRGFAAEYLRDDAWYCSPDDIDSIRDAVLKALDAPARPGLRDRILRCYTWNRAAEKTLEAYNQIL